MIDSAENPNDDMESLALRKQLAKTIENNRGHVLRVLEARVASDDVLMNKVAM